MTDATAYERALEFLKTRTNYEQLDRSGAPLGLAPMRALLAALGHPEGSIPAIHVAGSKGKGSVAWFLDALLRRAGVRAGRYLSPHLRRIEERIALDGTQLSSEAFGGAVLEVAPHAEGAGATFFDVLTAAAWAAFGRAGVDVAVLETGLGGRLDSTNATDVKWATVLTSVGLEHVDVLGGTLDAIAREKAAIARRGVPMFSAVRRGTEAGDAAAEVCRQAGAPFHALGEDFAVVNVAPDGEGLRAAVRCGARVYAGLRLPTPARYQAENLALAVAVVDNLAARGLVPEAARALSPAFAGNDLRIPGRFEVVPGRPTVLLDGAHTAESLTALFESVDAAFPERRRVAVVGVSRDKDLQRLSSAFLGRVDLVIATRAPTPRAADATAVAAALARVGVDARAAADAQEALTSAVSAAGAGGLVVVTGSLYLVAAAQAIFHPTESNP